MIKLFVAALPKVKIHAIGVGCIQGEPVPFGLSGEAKAEGFKSKQDEVAIVHPGSKKPAARVILVGMGKRDKIKPENLRRAAALAFKTAQRTPEQSFGFYIDDISAGKAQAAAEGLLLGSYKFCKYKTKSCDNGNGAAKNNNKDKELKQAYLLTPSVSSAEDARKEAGVAELFCEAACFARDLVNEPSSNKTPQMLARIARGIARGPVRMKIWEQPAIARLGMNCLLGVARGSRQAPVFIRLSYEPAGAKKSIALVGKGITFDSGGLSLKPSGSMETMKMDMAGAATVLSIFKVLPRLKPKMEVYGYMPITENMPGGNAMKPGDVVKALNGKTVEVLNTDAEGRLILADALAFAAREKPDQIIDMATLTGACIVALGTGITGIMANDKSLLKRIQNAADATGERVWEMPLPDDYKEQMKSKVADLKNIGGRHEAGAILGGLFLQEFVAGIPWAHMDIAGTAWADKSFSYCPEGATGNPVRTLLQLLSN